MATTPVLEDVLTVLRTHRLKALAAGVDLVGVVGSIARGDAQAGSDVDVVFDARDDMDYWRLGGLQMDLQDALGRRVDLIDRLMMRPERWRYMSEDLVPL